MNKKYKLKKIFLHLLIVFAFATFYVNTSTAFATDDVVDKAQEESDKNTTKDPFLSIDKKFNYSLGSLDITIDAISTGLLSIAIAFSTVNIATVGFNIIKNSSSDSGAIVVIKEEIKNKLSVLVFVLILPMLLTGIKTLTLPKNIGYYINSSYKNETLEELNTTQQDTFLTNFYKDRMKKIKAVEIKVLEEQLIEEEEYVSRHSKSYSADDSSGNSKKINTFFREVLTKTIYVPGLSFTNTISSIAYFPVTFSQNFYNHTTYDKVIKAATDSKKAETATKEVRIALSSLNFCVLIVYNFLYKVFFLVLQLICYIKSIKILLKNQEENIENFIKRLFMTVILFVLFPKILEFLLTLDIIFSSNISAMLGNIASGTSILALIPAKKVVLKSVCMLIISILAMFIAIALSFFFIFRRIFIIITFISSPFLFLSYLNNPKNSKLIQYIKRTFNLIFLNTIISPLFVLINLFAQLSNSNKPTKIFGLVFCCAIMLYSIQIIKKLKN